MSASSSSPAVRTTRRVAIAILLSVLSAAAVAGCTIPGKERLAGTPEEMPASLAYLPGDALGWVIVDPRSSREGSMELMRTLGMSDASFSVPIITHVVPGSGGADWAGKAVGVARYTARDDEPSRLTFADVAKRTELEHALEEAKWKRTSTKLDAGRGHTLTLWTRSGASGDDLGAIGINDEALVGAKDRTELATLLKHTRRYAASERPGTVDYTIDALKAAPIAVVFRSDQVRGDLRTLVSDSPALTEMTRWLTQASSIYALRDGWIGAVPAGGKRAGTDVRVIGRMDWARAATDVPEPKPVDRPKARDLGGADWAVAMANPGSYVKDIVEAISDGGNEFVTGEDAPKGTPKLGTLLDRLDGQALIRREGPIATVAVADEDPATTHRRAEAAIKLADVDWLGVQPTGDGLQFVVSGFASGDDATSIDTVERGTLPAVAAIDAALDAAGTAPSKPVAWVYLAKSPCDDARPAAGWISWHSPSQRLSWSFAVPVTQAADPDDRTDTAATPAANRCVDLLAG